MPRKYYRHDVKHQIHGQHHWRIKVEERIHINTVPLYFITSPGFVEGPASKDVDQDGGQTEAEGDEVHDVDADAVDAVFAHKLRVEEKEGVFHGPVTEKIEDV
jgi:hypothetical protein